MNRPRTAAIALAAACALVTGAAAQTMKINGAGATFPNPIYQKWFSEYNKLHRTYDWTYDRKS